MNRIDVLKKQDKLLLGSFNNDDVYKLGNYLSLKIIRNNLKAVVYIERNGVVLYQYCGNGITKNNLWWVKQKKKIVEHFDKSSALVSENFKEKPEMVKMYNGEFVFAGGGIPIKVKNVGTVGLIVVSGLSADQDHDLAFEGLEYLSKGDTA